MNRAEKIMSHKWKVYSKGHTSWEFNTGEKVLRSICVKCGLKGIRKDYLDNRYASAREKGEHYAVPEKIVSFENRGVNHNGDIFLSEVTIEPLSCEEMMIKNIIQ